MYLQGTADAGKIDAFVRYLEGLDSVVTGTNPFFNGGAISAFVHPDRIVSISLYSDLSVMTLTIMPDRNVGMVTTQGYKTLNVQKARDIYKANGKGITIGVISDSYNISDATVLHGLHATRDKDAGDLPKNLPPDPLPPAKLVLDGLRSIPNTHTDEGRAMMQIAYDIAPMADLCFATGWYGEASMAMNIRMLRTDLRCSADIIVDDLIYFDEPIFSDGQLAQAVNDVSNSLTLGGKRVAYFSAALNYGRRGSIDIANAQFSAAVAGMIENIDLTTVAACPGTPQRLSSKADAVDWLNFGSAASPRYFVRLTYSASGSDMIMQWDDRFYSRAVTTDLNLYMFDVNGNCVYSWAANNLRQDNGFERIFRRGGADGEYRIMIGRTNAGTRQAGRLRLINLCGWSGNAFGYTTPTTFGHSAAASAISVAAYAYMVFVSGAQKPIIENFSSAGPVTIAFTAAGLRLAAPETRKKPDIAAPDGVDTTFFPSDPWPPTPGAGGTDPDGTGYPNFFGTSAAAPHAAGVAALMLQKAGGRGSLTPYQVKSVLQTTAPARQLPYTSGDPVKGYNIYDGFGLIDAAESVGKICALVNPPGC